MKVSMGPFPKTGQRRILVKIDKYDTWGMDTTLSYIILPMLIQLKKTKHGIPGGMLSKQYTDLLADPNYFIEKGKGPLSTKEKKLFKDAIKKWNDILDDMIWSFREISKEHAGESRFFKATGIDNKGLAEYHEKIQHGTRLFGEHYQALWD